MDNLPKAVIFDWDNTLVDSWFLLHQAWNVTLKKMNFPEWSLSEVKQKVKASLRDSFPQLFGDRWQTDREIFLGFFAEHHLNYLKPMPGAEDLLKEFHRQGCYLAVVSNKSGGLLRKEATALGWNKYFGNIIGAGDALKDKPAVEPVEMALHQSGIVRGQQVWFLGDTDIDISCALNAGCRAILIRAEEPLEQEFLQAKPDLYVSSCQELMKALKTIY